MKIKSDLEEKTLGLRIVACLTIKSLEEVSVDRHSNLSFALAITVWIVFSRIKA